MSTGCCIKPSTALSHLATLRCAAEEGLQPGCGEEAADIHGRSSLTAALKPSLGFNVTKGAPRFGPTRRQMALLAQGCDSRDARTAKPPKQGSGRSSAGSKLPSVKISYS